MDIKKLIEEINSLTEDELVDEFEAPVVDNIDIVEEPKEKSTTDSLEAKTRISRAFDTLKDALDYFKGITAEELDLVQDSVLNSSIEQLSDDVWAIESCLNGEPKSDSTELTVVDEPEEVEDEVDDEIEDEESFDDEATLDLFGVEDNIEDEEE